MADNQMRGQLKVDTELRAKGAGQGRGVPVGDNGMAEAFGGKGGLSQSLSHVADRVGKLADHAAQVAGAAQGKQDGMDPEFRPRRDVTIYGEAYDQAALQVAQSRLRTSIDADFEDSFTKHGSSPQKLREVLAAKAKGYLTNAPEELRPDIDNLMRGQSLSLFRRAAREQQARAVSDQTAALNGDLEGSMRRLHQQAWAMGLDGQADAGIKDELSRIAGLLSRTGINGQPLVQPAQRQQILRQAERAATDARLLGAFERLPGADAKRQMIDQLGREFSASTGLGAQYDLDGIRRITAQLRSSLATSQAEERVRSAGLIDGIKQIEKFAVQGHPILPGQVAALAAQARASGNPDLLARVDAIEGLAAYQADMRVRNPLVLDGWAERLRRQIQQEGPTPGRVAQLEMTEKLAAEARKALKSDPLGWSHRSRYLPIPALDEKNLEGWLADRIHRAEDVAQNYGLEGPSYLRPEERRWFASKAAKGGKELIGIAETVTRVGGERAQAILSEIAKEGPVVAVIGGHVARIGASTPVARDAADGVGLTRVQGFKPIVGNADVREYAVKAHGGALNGLPQTEQALIAATNAAYEVRARRRGLDSVDETLWTQTYRDLLGETMIGSEKYGGIAVARPGRLWGGEGGVIVPPNVKNSGFRELIGAIRIEDFGGDPPRYGDKRPVQIGDLRRANLVQAGDGLYYLDLGDPGNPRYLKGRDGVTDYVLDLGRLEPALRARKPGLYLEGGPEPQRYPPGMMRLGAPGSASDSGRPAVPEGRPSGPPAGIGQAEAAPGPAVSAEIDLMPEAKRYSKALDEIRKFERGEASKLSPEGYRTFLDLAGRLRVSDGMDEEAAEEILRLLKMLKE